MAEVKLRQIGGSTCLTIPKAYLERLHLQAGAAVQVSVEGNSLRIEPKAPKYTLDELLGGMPENPEILEEDREWLDDSPVGKELW